MMNAGTEPAGRHIGWQYAFLALGILLVYFQTLRFGFVNYDDDELIYHNARYLERWSNIPKSFTTHAFAGAGGESVYYRPVLISGYIIEYHLWRLQPAGYHLVNLLLHLLTVFLVIRLARLLGFRNIAACFAGALFALHPVQTEAVAWIAGRNDILLAVFCLGMIISYIRFRTDDRNSELWAAATAACFALALFTKESAAFYLLCLPAWEFTAGRMITGPRGRRPARKMMLVMAGVLIAYLAVRLAVFGSVIGAERLYGHLPAGERIARLPGIVAEHLRLLFYPSGLSVTHPVDELPWFSTTGILLATVLTALFPAGLIVLRKRGARYFLPMVLLSAGFLPLLGLIPVPIPILEHRLYLPLAGFAILLAAAFTELTGGSRTRVAAAAGLIVIAALAYLSYERLPVWRNGRTLFSDAVDHSPRDLRSIYSLAVAREESDDHEGAIDMLRTYTTLAPDDPRGFVFLREVCYRANQGREVLDCSLHLMRMEPGSARRCLEAGVAYEELFRPDSALMLYRESLRRDSTSADAHLRSAVVLVRLGQDREAIPEFRNALRYDKDNDDAYFGLARIYLGRRDTAAALGVLDTAAHALTPSDATLRLYNTLRSRIPR